MLTANGNEIPNHRFEFIPCPICGSELLKSCLSVRYGDLKQKKSLDYSVLGISKDTPLFVKRCLDCDFVFVNPRLKPEFGALIYNECKQKMYEHKSYLTSIGTKENLVETRKRKLSYIGPLVETLSHAGPERDELILFDYGCGFGYSMSLARELGIKTYGMDIDEERLAVCRRLGLNVATPAQFDQEFPNVRADIILLQSNIEHLLDLRGTMRYLEKKSNEHAVLYVNGLTPKIIKIERKRNHFVKAHFVEHVNYFPIKTLDWFMEKHHFLPVSANSAGLVGWIRDASKLLSRYVALSQGAFARIYRYHSGRENP